MAQCKYTSCTVYPLLLPSNWPGAGNLVGYRSQSIHKWQDTESDLAGPRPNWEMAAFLSANWLIAISSTWHPRDRLRLPGSATPNSFAADQKALSTGRWCIPGLPGRLVVDSLYGPGAVFGDEFWWHGVGLSTWKRNKVPKWLGSSLTASKSNE